MEDLHSSIPKTDKFNKSLNQREESVSDENEERARTITTSTKQCPESVAAKFDPKTREHRVHGISKPNLLKKSLLFRLQKLHLKQCDHNTNKSVYEQQLPEAWRKLSKVGAMDNIGRWRLKTADQTARRLVSAVVDRKVTTAPAVTNKENNGDTIDKSGDACKLSPVQEAFVNAMKLRQSIREDKLAGISVSNTWLSNITSKGNNRADTLKAMTESGQNRIVREIKEHKNEQRKEKHTYSDPRFKPPPIPAKFTFPKCTDFIVMEDNAVKNLSIGWKINSMFKTNIVESTTYKKNELCGSTIRGQLRKEVFPVTEAMNKHGTSISKRRVKALKPGDITVSKVWNRSLKRESSAVSPYKMAREDVRIKLDPEDEWKIPSDTKTVMSDYQHYQMPRYKSARSRRNLGLVCY